MAQLTDLEKVRRRRTWRKRVQSLMVLAVFAAVVTAASLLVYHKGEMDIKTAVSDITAEITTGSGFPTILPGGKLLEILPMENTIAVVADNNFYTYNDTGRRLLDIQHGMINPAVSTAGGRLLAYDRGANKVMIFSRSGLIRQLTSDFALYDGDIAKNGNFALASGSDNFLSMVTVYNGEGGRIVRYNFADRPASCVSLADSRESIVIGLVDVRAGEFLSTIVRHQFSVKDPTAQLELPGELLLDMDYHDGGSVHAVTDQRAVSLDNSLREQASFSFGDQQLLRFCFGSDGRMLLHLRDATGIRRGRAVLLDSRMEPLCIIEANEELDGMKLDSDGIYLLRKGELAVYDFAGRSAGELPVGGAGLFQPMNGMVYYTTASEINAVSVKDLSGTGSQSAAGASQPDRWQAVRDALLGGSSADAQASPDEESASEAVLEEAPSDGGAQAESGTESRPAESSSAQSGSHPDRWQTVKDALLGNSPSGGTETAEEESSPETGSGESASGGEKPEDGADRLKAASGEQGALKAGAAPEPAEPGGNE